MTFQEASDALPHGFHDAEIENLTLDYKGRTLSLLMKVLVGAPGTVDQEELAYLGVRVNELYFCSIDPPDPNYPFQPDGSAIQVSGDAGLFNSKAEVAELASKFPAGIEFYRFFVEQWNSFICIAGSNVEISCGSGPNGG